MDVNERIDILERQVEDLCKGVLKIQKSVELLEEALVTVQKSLIGLLKDKGEVLTYGKDQT